MKAFLEYSLQLIVAFGGLTAYIIYRLQKRNEYKTAATLIVEQIDHIEAIISSLRRPENRSNREIFKQPSLLAENYWEKYKILFMKKMKQSQIKSLDDYFNNVQEIAKGAEAIKNAMLIAWEYRSLSHQIGVGELVLKCLEDKEFQDFGREIPKELSDKMTPYFNLLRAVDDLFTAGLAQDVYYINLSLHESIKSSAAYDYLDKKSFRN